MIPPDDASHDEIVRKKHIHVNASLNEDMRPVIWSNLKKNKHGLYLNKNAHTLSNNMGPCYLTYALSSELNKRCLLFQPHSVLTLTFHPPGGGGTRDGGRSGIKRSC